MDIHLQFIVDQTQKYSNWLVQGMGGGSTPSATPSIAPSLTPTTPSTLLSENSEWNEVWGMGYENVTLCRFRFHVYTCS